MNNVINIYYGVYGKMTESNMTDITYYKEAGLPMIGAIIYVFAKAYKPFKKTQTEICNICGCTEVTLRDKRDKFELYLKTYESENSPQKCSKE